MTRIIGVIALALTLCLPAAPAEAAIYTWTISGAFSGSGTLTTTDTPFTYDELEEPISGQSAPGYLVTSMTGRFANRAVSLVTADPDAAPFFASNLLYVSGTAPYLDDRGLLFRTSLRTYSLFAMETCEGVGAGDAQDNCRVSPAIGYPGISGGSRNVTFAISAVPEPSTWATMLAGFSLVSLATRRRRSTGRTVAA